MPNMFNIISCAGLLNIPLTDFHNNMSTPSIKSANKRLGLSLGFRATSASQQLNVFVSAGLSQII